MAKARYIMIGGFLGAGKTTAVLQLAQHLKKQRPKRWLDYQRPKFWPGGYGDAELRTGFPWKKLPAAVFAANLIRWSKPPTNFPNKRAPMFLSPNRLAVAPIYWRR